MSADDRLHPYLRESLPRLRAQLFARQAERLVAFERIDERIVERHFDEQERLRLHRVIERQVKRGLIRERYAEVLGEFAEGRLDRPAAETTIARLLDEDAKAFVARAAAESFDRTIDEYRALVPADRWPRLLCMAEHAGDVGVLEADLRRQGLDVERGRLARIGILRVACPPELPIAMQLVSFGRVAGVADGEAPTGLMPPARLVVAGADVRALMGITADMQDERNATIAVLDTGLDVAHPAFTRRLQPGDYRNFTSSTDADEDGHGTQVAFVAGGDGAFTGNRYSGVAPKCRLIAAKVYGGGLGTLESVLDGMVFALERGADVVSLSVLERKTPANGRSFWTRACDELFHQGVLVCVAAGNLEDARPGDLTPPGTIMVPGDAATAITVGAIDAGRRLVYFSAKGEEEPDSPLWGKPNCAGPGVDLTVARSSAAPVGDDEGAGLLVNESGTSLAAPAVAGCLALLKSRARALGWEIPPAPLREIFLQACCPLEDEQGNPYGGHEIGHGLVDMGEAMRVVEARAALAARTQPATVAFGAGAVGVVPRPVPAPAQAGAWAANTCYCCGHSRHSRVGMFSDAMRCATCDAPLCMVCWSNGERGCSKHLARARALVPEPVSAPAPQPARAVPPPPAAITGADVMTTLSSPTVDPEALGAGEDFLNHFAAVMSEKPELVHPVTGRAAKFCPPMQTPRLRFGNLRRFNYRGGLPKLKLVQSKLTVVALALNEVALEQQGGVLVPRHDLVQWIEQPDGIDVDPNEYYYVGVYSPVGWPAGWTKTMRTANATYWFISRHRDDPTGTWWDVKTVPPDFRSAFNPESEDEEVTRAARALVQEPELAAGSQKVMDGDEFCEKYHVSPAAAARAAAESKGAFRIVSHSGRTIITRR